MNTGNIKVVISRHLAEVKDFISRLDKMIRGQNRKAQNIFKSIEDFNSEMRELCQSGSAPAIKIDYTGSYPVIEVNDSFRKYMHEGNPTPEEEKKISRLREFSITSYLQGKFQFLEGITDDILRVFSPLSSGDPSFSYDEADTKLNNMVKAYVTRQVSRWTIKDKKDLLQITIPYFVNYTDFYCTYKHAPLQSFLGVVKLAVEAYKMHHENVDINIFDLIPPINHEGYSENDMVAVKAFKNGKAQLTIKDAVLADALRLLFAEVEPQES